MIIKYKTFVYFINNYKMNKIKNPNTGRFIKKGGMTHYKLFKTGVIKTFFNRKYNDYFINQLTELLTQYGRVDEVWFDGANGEGPFPAAVQALLRETYPWPG